MIVKMSVPLQPGDTVRVHEIGAGTGGSAEPCTVAIARSQAGPFRVVSLMSREAADELGLEVGVLAVASAKATVVTVERPEERA